MNKRPPKWQQKFDEFLPLSQQQHTFVRSGQLTETCGYLSPDIIRLYITFAQVYNPFIPEELTEWLALLYAEIRREELLNYQGCSYTTPRSLISVLRMSQAFARINLRDRISSFEVEESLRLIQVSKTSVFSEMIVTKREDQHSNAKITYMK